MLIIFISLAIFLIISLIAILVFRKIKNKLNSYSYEKKPYLFDNVSEFELFKILVELFGDDYFVFPQVHYSHLVKPKRAGWGEERRLRSRIDRKSADFVFCDREKVIPRLVVELDGKVHSYTSKRERDEFVNELMKTTGLPIIHLNPDNLDKDSLKKEILKALNQA